MDSELAANVQKRVYMRGTVDVPYGAEGSKEGKAAREEQLGVLSRKRNMCRTLNGARRENVATPAPRTQTRSMQKLLWSSWLTDFTPLCLTFLVLKGSLETVPNSVTLFHRLNRLIFVRHPDHYLTHIECCLVFGK